MKAPAPFFAFLLLLVQKASSQSVSGTQEVYSKSLPDFEAASSPCGIEDVSGKTYFFQVFLLCLSVDISVNGEVKLYENSVVSCTTTGTNGKAYTTISTAASVGSDGSLNFEGNYDGKVSFAEDKSLDKVESNLKLIDPQNLLFDIQLSLPSCNSPSSVPSSAPSNLASASPSSVPSLVPSYRPSSVPTSIPSRYPPCDVSEVTGKTYYLTLLGTCIELELAVAGTISIYSNQGNTCPPTSLTKTIISRYDGDNSNENVINFTAEGPNGLPGSVTFRQDLVDEVTSIVSLQAGNVFNIEVVLPSCDSPSASPTIFTSNVPTSVPSAEPSLSFEPSEKPSQTPSIVLSNPPSELASVSPSSVPTMLPSILPTRVPECIIEEVSGKTYYFKMITICFKVEMFPGGKMSTLIVGFNDPCEANTSGLETEISAYDASQSTDMMAVYSGSGANDWNGEFLFRQDTISALQISTTKFDTQTQEFSFTMTLPSCDAPSAAPSFVPVCDIEEVLDDTIYVAFNNGVNDNCYKIDFFDGGVFAVDEGNSNCTNAFVATGTSPYSRFKNFTDNYAYFDGTGVAGWEGRFGMKRSNDVTDGTFEVMRWDVGSKAFEIDVVLPTCPGTLCDASKFSGITTTPVSNLCLKFDLAGEIYVDNTDATCTSTTPDFQLVSEFDYVGVNSVHFKEAVTPGSLGAFTGTITFKEHPGLSENETEFSYEFLTSSSFNLDYVVKSCPL